MSGLHRSWLVLMLPIFAVPSCDLLTNASTGEAQVPPPPPEPFQLILDVPAEATRGEGIPMQLVLRNTGADSVEVALGGSSTVGIHFDLVVLDSERRVIHTRWHDATLEASARTYTLGPGEAVEIEWEWNQQDSDGEKVEAGRYEVFGVLILDGPVGTEPAPLTIR